METKCLADNVPENDYLQAGDNLAAARLDYEGAKDSLFLACCCYRWAVDDGIINNRIRLVSRFESIELFNPRIQVILSYGHSPLLYFQICLLSEEDRFPGQLTPGCNASATAP